MKVAKSRRLHTLFLAKYREKVGAGSPKSGAKERGKVGRFQKKFGKI